MRFLVDNQLPAALVGLVREQGHEAEHVLELGLAQGKDNPDWIHKGPYHSMGARFWQPF